MPIEAAALELSYLPASGERCAVGHVLCEGGVDGDPLVVHFGPVLVDGGKDSRCGAGAAHACFHVSLMEGDLRKAGRRTVARARFHPNRLDRPARPVPGYG